MNEKLYSILKISIIFIIMILMLVLKFIPEYKETQGSSDKYIDLSSYESLIEIKINNSTNFILVLKEKIINNILFLDDNSFCLYNKNIEGTDISTGINEIINELSYEKLIYNNVEINIIKYNNKYYDDVKTELTKRLTEKEILYSLVEKNMTLKEKAKNLSLSGSDDDSYLSAIQLYSKEIVRSNKNKSQYNESSSNENVNSETIKLYADAIYEKLTTYMITNEIQSQDILDTSLPIYLLPADAEATIYPTSDSWYYIEDNKVYAYISFLKDDIYYKYCYQGNLIESKEGEC